MTHHKKHKKHCKKECPKTTSELIPTNNKSYHCNNRNNSQCKCEQLFYTPLPNLAVRPPTQSITTSEWFAPGSVQSCCSICSSVKPLYATPCTGYCCKQY